MLTRRNFLKGTGVLIAGTVANGPLILTRSVLGADTPSKKINIGMIGMGRQMMGANLKPFLVNPKTQVVAVCDVDSWRMENGKKAVEDYYGKQKESGTWKGCRAYGDFRELLANKDIDAVMISTPDHWHAVMAIMAAKAGKDVSCEKPLNLSIREGRLVADAMKKYGRIFRTDSEFRSGKAYHRVCELVRNGRIGKLHTIRTGCPIESFAGEAAPDMPVPKELDYDFWMGPAPKAPYTENRVHTPKNIKARPGWMRVRDYCDGMICNWGTHLNDIAQWGNRTDDTGPVEVEATGEFHKGVLWNVLKSFNAKFKYVNGVELFYTMSDPHVRFEGDKGWVQVAAKNMGLYASSGVSASSDEILKSEIGPNEEHLLLQGEKENFIDCVISRKRPLADAEVGHRTNSICHLAHISIQLGGKKLKWDPDKEVFDDEAANKLLSRSFYRGEWNPEKV
ncbi:MAG: Gfo/Idh/MocA family oxidoreductase [Kiritimatiellae bacterium]|nr:Gfo/Idh/MocA family oxidoreductase [Kiritimatiellia bacterium]MDD5522900.1 Gfo/Idh/MocA family oxidoreductase [Kiritimatiellia bacterium]